VVVQGLRVGRRAVVGLGAAALLAAALAAGYWLPVLTQVGDLNPAALTAEFFDYHSHFIPLAQLVQGSWAYDYSYDPARVSPFTFGRAQVVLILAATAWALVARPPQRRVFIYAALVVGVLLWLQQAGAKIVWDHAPFARYVQFPYRLSTYAGVMTF